MKKIPLKHTCSIAMFFFLVSCASVTLENRGKAGAPDFDRVMDSISSRKLMDYTKELSSEMYAGRLSGTQKCKKAAEWVASLLRKWDISPGGEKGTYLQSFPNPYTTVFEGGELAYHYDKRDLNKKKYYEYETDYYPGSDSGSGAVTAEVVYVGYGIYAPELDYNDYENVDVNGKIVFMEPGIPVSQKENPELFKEWRHYSLNPYKAKIAVAQGAKAMLYNDLKIDPCMGYIEGFLVSHVGDSVAKDIFSGTAFSPQEAREEIRKKLAPCSFETGKIFTMENLTEHHSEGTGYNVIGYLRGGDPDHKDEVIIIGAHLNHTGFCCEIMPGADDNASGAAVLLGAAEALSRNPAGVRRSVLFIGFGSKEQSLMGSKEYLKDPLFPAEKTVLFINIDMVGNGRGLKVFGAEDFPELWKAVRRSNKKKVGMNLIPETFDSPDWENSDADSFLKKKIPSLSFRSDKVPDTIYTARDTPDKLNPDLMRDLSHLLAYVIIDMANSKR
ncbi:MAG: M28 family peptidase [Candidatus Aminicenantes bacterium]|nr:M28 family peptidase [Candidatus Aminicenantes bacterium]